MPTHDDDPRDALLRRLGELRRSQHDEQAAAPSEDDALRPLDEAERDDITALLLGSAATEVPDAPTAAPAQEAKILPFKRPAAPPPVAATPGARRRTWLTTGGALAAAAAVAVALWYPGPASGPGLPEYSLGVLAGGTQMTRAETDTVRPVLPFSRGDRLDFTLRPVTAASGPPRVACYVLQGGRLTPWEGRVVVDPAGAVRVRGEVGVELVAPSGPAELVFVLAAGPLPGVEALAPVARGDAPPPALGVRVLRQPVTLP